jgi:hypothetical protein
MIQHSKSADLKCIVLQEAEIGTYIIYSTYKYEMD